MAAGYYSTNMFQPLLRCFTALDKRSFFVFTELDDKTSTKTWMISFYSRQKEYDQTKRSSHQQQCPKKKKANTYGAAHWLSPRERWEARRLASKRNGHEGGEAAEGVGTAAKGIWSITAGKTSNADIYEHHDADYAARDKKINMEYCFKLTKQINKQN